MIWCILGALIIAVSLLIQVRRGEIKLFKDLLFYFCFDTFVAACVSFLAYATIDALSYPDGWKAVLGVALLTVMVPCAGIGLGVVAHQLGHSIGKSLVDEEGAEKREKM